MNERDLELTGLVFVRELLRNRGTDTSELEREIARLTRADAVAQPSRRAQASRARRPAVPVARAVSS